MVTPKTPQRHGYPRPQLVRTAWASLNGRWEFAFDPDAAWHLPGDVTWQTTITVPFAPETPASGLNDEDFHPVVWYRRTFEAPPLENGARMMLHFGAVDDSATVWVNDTLVARHEGGYTPLSTDITDYLEASGPQTVVVRAADDPHDLAKPRGKQDWLREPHRIWYPRTTGIWQTVWLEPVSATCIRRLDWTPNVLAWEIGMEAVIDGPLPDDLRLQVTLYHGETLLADDTYALTEREVTRRIALVDPGIGDARAALLWSPEHPNLIGARLHLWDGQGNLLDSVESYTALRSIGVQGNRVTLNGRPYYLRMVLDQGYWPQSGLTAPSDEALKEDVERTKELGFNGARKHQKIEDPRYLFWADTLGLLVWEEMPSAYRFTRAAIERTMRAWTEAIARDRSHPCIIAWVPFNESWGVPDLPNAPEQREYVRALYALTKTLDPTRFVIGNDGWEHVETDLLTLHDYEGDPERLARRYAPDGLTDLFARGLPAGRLLSFAANGHRDCPILLTEFGGIAFSNDPSRTWGYSRSGDAREFREQYEAILRVVRNAPLFAGFCYTQLTDAYQETNGLLYADRSAKIDTDAIAAATRG